MSSWQKPVYVCAIQTDPASVRAAEAMRTAWERLNDRSHPAVIIHASVEAFSLWLDGKENVTVLLYDDPGSLCGKALAWSVCTTDRHRAPSWAASVLWTVCLNGERLMSFAERRFRGIWWQIYLFFGERFTHLTKDDRTPWTAETFAAASPSSPWRRSGMRSRSERPPYFAR